MYTESEARSKWRYLRDYYRRQKSEVSKTKSGQAATHKPLWKHSRSMQFLDKHIQMNE